MATVRKFMHRAMLDYFRRGKLRVQCACGKQSPVFQDVEFYPDDESFLDSLEGDESGKEIHSKEERAREWYENHHGLAEIKPGKRGV